MNNLINIFKAVIIGFITGLGVSIPLGPAGIESVNRTICSGFKHGLIVSAGAIFADITYILLINFGLKNLFYSNKFTEPLFWIVSGLFLFLTSIISLKNGKLKKNKSEHKSKDNYGKYGFITGFIITFTNPLTPSLWLTLSGTVFERWKEVGNFYYLLFILSTLGGMIVWFTVLNLFAYKGLKFLSSNKKHPNFSVFFNFIILGIGIIFMFLGFNKFYKIFY